MLEKNFVSIESDTNCNKIDKAKQIGRKTVKKMKWPLFIESVKPFWPY